MSDVMQVWTLARRPEGAPQPEDLRCRKVPLGVLGDGQVRVRNTWLTVGPAMRVRMSTDSRGYLRPFDLDAPLPGPAVGVVVASQDAAFVEGDHVLHQLGMRDIAQGLAAEFELLPRSGLGIEHYLNALGSTGFTAYHGVVRVCEGRAGETMFVSGAAGAVGSTAVQIGKLLGMRVVASAGGPEKGSRLQAIGADAVIDYKSAGRLEDKLAEAAPDGIDAFLDNVGGAHLDAALASSRPHARFALSGMIGSYNDASPSETMRHLNRIITQRIRLEGYLAVADHAAEVPHFRKLMTEWIEDGSISPWQTIVDGLSAVPDILANLFAGEFAGKPLIRI